MNVSTELTKRLKDGSIKTCLDFINWCGDNKVKYDDKMFVLFYKTKRIFLKEKGVYRG